MSKTSAISVRIDPNTKNAAEEVLERIGLTPSQAIVLFYRQVALHQGLPFALIIPAQDTQEALAEAAQRDKLPSFTSPEALFDDLGI